MRTVIFFWAVLVVAIATAGDERQRNAFDHDILAETFGYGPDTESLVDYEALYQGCPRRDCIPAIDDPVYVPAAEADFMAPDTIILGIDYGGEQRAYPLPIMDHHEIVNDEVGGQPVAVTWCPLCGSGIVFDRVVDGETLSFGVSGLLHESDLVMYDRKTKSLWQQISGDAIMGPKMGTELKALPSTMTEWSTWREAHADTLVLTPAVMSVDYFEAQAYASYAESERLAFPVSRRDLTIHPKTVVYGFEFDEQSLAVMESSLDESGALEASVGDIQLRVERLEDGSVIATDQAGQRHEPIRLFWFAWYSFHPDTEKI